MRTEWQEYLNNTYSFYRGYFDKGVAFECGDGWFQLLKELSEEIQKLLERDKLTASVYQVKEKYGTLRFYGSFPTQEIDDIIWFYERKSAEVCENCGAPSTVKEYGTWLYNMCDDCFNERIK